MSLPKNSITNLYMRLSLEMHQEHDLSQKIIYLQEMLGLHALIKVKGILCFNDLKYIKGL